MTYRPAYGEFAEHYQALFGGLDAACLDFVQCTVRPPATLLDAGCGTGRYAAALAARGYQVVAIDRERDLIQAGKVPSAAVDLALADLRRLPFVTWFDLILARGVLNDFVQPGDLARALKSLAAALRRNGRLIADVREREAHRRRIRERPLINRTANGIAFRAWRTIDESHTIISREQFAREDGSWSSPFEFRMRTFTEEEVRSLWREAGLEVVSIDGSYGPGSRLTDRLVVVARRASPEADRASSGSE